MKLLADFFPIILFFVTFKAACMHPDQAADILNSVMHGVTADQAPVLAATFVAIVATLLQVALKYARGQRPEPALWISLAVIVVFGSLTLWLHNEWFIKAKPSILYWIFAAILLWAQLTGRLVMKKLMAAQMPLTDQAWRRFQWAWIGFFVFAGLLNVLVAWGCSTETWVNFKLFGLMGLTFIFTIAAVLWVMKNGQPPEN